VARLIGPAAAAKQLGIARSTVYRLLEQPAADTQHSPGTPEHLLITTSITEDAPGQE
jgi:hypothetical protein